MRAAVDAAVATALSLFVTEPAGSGIGGQASFIIHSPGRAPVALNGTSFAPAATVSETPRDELVGIHATTVPNALRTLDFALRQYGSGKVSWAQVLEPAIRQAEVGFALGHFRHVAVKKYADKLRTDPVAARVFLGPQGNVPKIGAQVRQPLLAATLRRLAEHGADDFYRGAIAREIAEHMEQVGGWVTAADLAAVPEPMVVAPIEGEYRGLKVYSLPPPAGGWVVAQMLGMLDRTPAEQLAVGQPTRVQWLAQALQAGHAQRAEHPIANLVDYGVDVRGRLDGARITALVDAFEQGEPVEPEEALDEEEEEEESGETTHFTVADSAGTVVSVTMSLNAYFGARVVHPTLGFLYNDYMREFRTEEPEHPFALKPGGMPYSSMSATVLARGDTPVVGLGSPGSARIISAVVQVASHWADGDQDIAAAVAAPRVHPKDGVLYVETMPSPQARAVLQQAGLEVEEKRSEFTRGKIDPYFGGVHAVALEGDAWVGAADPRRDGKVVRVPQ